MKKAWIVREKGYEYNDNWYDLDEEKDRYTELFLTEQEAITHSKKATAEFISGRYVYDYFNDQPYLPKIKSILESDEFPNMSVGDSDFEAIYDIIKNDTSQVLEIEIEDGDPYIISLSDGTKMYYKNNVLHRVDGPAIIKPNGRGEWYYDGKLHRIGGPARVTSYGDEDFYVAGNNYWQPEKYQEAVRKWTQENRNVQIDNIVNK